MKKYVLSVVVVLIVLLVGVFLITQRKVNENTNLPQIELSDLPGDFSIQNNKEDSSSVGEEKTIGFENKAFQDFDLSSYSKAQKQEFISYMIVHYNDGTDLLKRLEGSRSFIDGKNNILLDTKNIKIGDDLYMYKSIKPVVVEGHNSIILGLTFKIDNVIVSISDSGFDETLLKDRVIALSKIMESRVKDYLER